MGFKELTIGLIMISLFSFSLINFVIMTQQDNEVTDKVINDPALNGINDTLYDSFYNLQDTAQGQREVFEGQEAVGSTDEGFSLTAIVGNVKTFFSTAMLSVNVVFSLIQRSLGIPSIVLNLLLGIIIIVTLLLIWRVIKGGGT